MSAKIVITTETDGSARDSHARWLLHMIGVPLRSAVAGADVRREVFDAASAADLFIGFELSESGKKELNGAGRVWIDLRIAPVRFLDDIYLTFETNHDGIRKRLETYRISETLVKYHAELIRATVLKLKKADIVPSNTLLLIGQTERDRVVFDGKKYLTLADRLPELGALAKPYDHVWFKPHPYAKNGRRLLRELRKGLGHVENTRENIYCLLANDGVTHVAALNSGVLHEAGHFGKEVTFLHTPTFDAAQTGVYGDYFSSAFWADILSPVFQTVSSDLSLPFVPSRLRKTLNDFWGYNAVSDEVVLRDVLKEKIQSVMSFFR